MSNTVSNANEGHRTPPFTQQGYVCTYAPPNEAHRRQRRGRGVRQTQVTRRGLALSFRRNCAQIHITVPVVQLQKVDVVEAAPDRDRMSVSVERTTHTHAGIQH